MNVGSATGSFKLTGLKESIADLKRLVEVLRTSSLSYQKNRKEQAAVIAAMKQSSAEFKKAAGNARFFAGAIKNVDASLKKMTMQAKLANYPFVLLAASAKKFNYIPTILDRIRGTFGTLTSSAQQFSRSIFSIGTRGVSFVKRMGAEFRKLNTRLQEGQGAIANWLARFGRVAAGFWIAYRAINAVEFAIKKLSQTFVRGATLVDEYGESIATVSGMLGLMSAGLGGFEERYQRFYSVMKGTMEESIRLAPKYRLSLEDIGNAYKEFAQFGVVITRDITEPTMNSIAMIKEIATTTQGSARQIRQEIQAIFNGQTRITDQFGRFIKNFPEITDQIFGIARANVTNQEKWVLVIEAMKEYQRVFEDSNRTITNQTQIISNNLAIISSKALTTSGIYKQWIDTMVRFNSLLFDDKGNLKALGKEIYVYFYRTWQVIQKLISSLWSIAKVSKVIFDFLAYLISPIQGILGVVLKLVIASMVLKTVFTFIVALVLKLWTIFITSAIWVFGKLIVVSFAPLIGIFAAIVVLVVALTVAFSALSGVIAGLWAAYKVSVKPIEKALYVFEYNIRAIVHNIQEMWAKLKDSTYKVHLKTMLKNDFSDFSGQGEDAANAFFKGYQDQITANEKALAESWGNIKDVFAKMKKNIIDFYGATDVGKGLMAFIDEMTELFKFDPVIFPAIKDFVDDLSKMKLGLDGPVENALTKLKTLAEYLTDEFSTVFTDVFSGEITKLNDLWDRSMDAIVTSFEKAMADLTTAYFEVFIQGILEQSTMKTVADFFGDVASAYLGNSNYVPDSGKLAGADRQYASGGTINEPVFGIGQRSGETYSFAEKRPETVIPHGGLTMPKFDVVVNVINKTSQEVNAKQTGARFDGRRYIVETVLTDIERGGPLRSAFKGVR